MTTPCYHSYCKKCARRGIFSHFSNNYAIINQKKRMQ
ncbi:hypothetical protein [Sulfuricurvum sp.]